MATIFNIDDLPGEDADAAPAPTPVGEPKAELVEISLNREAEVATYRYRIRQEMSDGSWRDLGTSGVNLTIAQATDPALTVQVGGQDVTALAALKALNKSANRIRVCYRDALGPWN